MNQDEMIALEIARISAAFPDVRLTQQTVAVYIENLRDLPMAVIQLAVTEALLTSEFFPKIAKIRATAAALMTRDLNIPTAGEAWGEVLEKINTIGSMQDFGGIAAEDLGFSHPLITKIVRELGWQNLCMSTNQIADRARFLDLYDRERANTEGLLRLSPELKAGLPGPVQEDIKRLAAQMSHQKAAQAAQKAQERLSGGKSTDETRKPA